MRKLFTSVLVWAFVSGCSVLPFGAAPTDEIVDVCGLLSAARKSVAGDEGVASIELDCKSRVQLQGSTAEIESVIVNLLSNALRYTPADGKITLTWETHAEGGDLSVTDTGIGVEPENVPRLTERFFRVDRGHCALGHESGSRFPAGWGCHDGR